MTAKTELVTTIERIRAEHFADLPKSLVEAMIKIESEFTEDPVEAHKRVATAVENHLKNNKDR